MDTMLDAVLVEVPVRLLWIPLIAHVVIVMGQDDVSATHAKERLLIKHIHQMVITVDAVHVMDLGRQVLDIFQTINIQFVNLFSNF
jgi:hypothetical protein